MTALVNDFNGPWDNGQPLPARIEGLPVKAGQKLYGGGMVVLRPSNGFVYSAANAVLGDIALGRADAQYDNTNGVDGAITARVFFGSFGYFNSAGGDAIATKNIGQPCYIVDDCTLALTAGGGSRVLAGPIVHVDSVTGLVFAEINPVTNGLANFAGGGEDTAQPEAFHTVRGVVNTNQTLTAFASVTGGTIVDGVTYAQFDRVLLTGQTTASQNGIWVVGAVSSGSAPLTRPADFASGSVLPAESYVAVSEGTLNAHSLQRLITQGSAIVIDTTSLSFVQMEDASQCVNPNVRCVASSNITIATALVTGQVIDGVTLLAGDRVLVANQTTGSQNGIYVASAAPAVGVYAPDWVQGQVKAGVEIKVSEGTAWSNSTWRATAAQASVGGYYTVGTTDPLFYPRIFNATVAIGTPNTAAWIIKSTAMCALNDQTSSTTGTKAVLVAGRGTGTITLTGTGTDSVQVGIANF